MRHLLIKEPNEPLQDLYFFVHLAEATEGEPEQDGPNGENVWIRMNELSSQETSSYLEDLIALRDQKTVDVQERLDMM